jgi:hypothetical protein
VGLSVSLCEGFLASFVFRLEKAGRIIIYSYIYIYIFVYV